jgi:small subunit ribosomal protein S16
MLRIRLSRTGKKKQANYRVVVADVDAKRDGRVVERIGHYNPHNEPVDYSIDEGRALYWLSVGAQPSGAVELLLKKQGTIERLGRLRQGESLDSLVAEYGGVEVAPAKEPVKMPVVEEPVAVEQVAAMVEDLVTDEEE